MSRLTFKQAKESVQDQPAGDQFRENALPLVVPETSEMPLAEYYKDAEAQGEFTNDDTENAFLSVVAKVGEMSNLFTPGEILINKEIVIGNTKTPLEVVVVAMKKRYQNDLAIEGKELGDEVDTALEVAKRGGVVEYRPYDDKGSTHFWKPILKTMLLVKKPDGVSEEAAVFFPYELNGVSYGVVAYTARTKTAYNGVALPLGTIKRAGKSIRSKVWKLATKGETWEDRSWIQISLRATGVTPKEVLDFITENGF